MDTIIDLDWGWKSKIPNIEYEATVSFSPTLTDVPEGKKIGVFPKDNPYYQAYYTDCFEWDDFLSLLNIQFPRPKPWTKGLAKKHFTFREGPDIYKFSSNEGLE